MGYVIHGKDTVSLSVVLLSDAAIPDNSIDKRIKIQNSTDKMLNYGYRAKNKQPDYLLFDKRLCSLEPHI